MITPEELPKATTKRATPPDTPTEPGPAPIVTPINK